MTGWWVMSEPMRYRYTAWMGTDRRAGAAINLREPGRQRARWSLAREFMLASLFVLLASGLVMGMWEGRQIEQSALRDNAAVSSLFVDSIVSPSLQSLAAQDRLADADTGGLDRLLNTGPLRAQVVALKIWSPGGEILYSPNRDLIGRRFPVDDDLRRALDGAVTAQLGDLLEPENEYERQHWARLMSVYVPVRADGDARVIAVTEFYQLPDRLEREIRSAQIRSWAVVAALTAATYLLLAGIVGRGSATIGRQRRALDTRVATLQRLLAENALLGERVRQAGIRTTTLNERALRRISADLHDGPGQVLALALMRMAEQPNERHNGVFSADDHAVVQGAVRAALADIRAISSGLLLPELDGLSVRAVVERAVRDHTRRSGTAVALTLGDLPERAPPAVVIVLFRTLQEALSNATRHGKGVAVDVAAWQEAGRLCLRVADRGPGVSSMAGRDDGGHHLGLAGMRERAQLLGGDFTFTSAPGAGAVVEARWPLAEPEDPWESSTTPEATVSR